MSPCAEICRQAIALELRNAEQRLKMQRAELLLSPEYLRLPDQTIREIMVLRELLLRSPDIA